MSSAKRTFILSLLLLFSFTGCTKQPSTPSTASNSSIVAPPDVPSSSSASLKESSAAPVESAALSPFHTSLRLYLYQPDTALYLKQQGEPSPATLVQVLEQVATALHLPTPPVRSIRQNKGMVTVDFSKEVLDLYTVAQQSTLFHSFNMTLHHNHESYQWTQFQVEGDWQPFGMEQWETAPLLLMEPDAAAFQAIRQQMPYLPRTHSPNQIEELRSINTDETSQQIADLLSSIRLEKTTFADPSELSPSHLIETAIHNTQYYVNPAWAFREPNAPTLEASEPIFASISQKLGMQEDWIWLQEHVEQTAKQMYGDDLNLTHQTAYKYTYFPLEGVYTPPHMGGGYNLLTAVLDYEDQGSQVQAIVAYAIYGMGGYSSTDFETTLEQTELKHYFQTEAARYQVILGKHADGSLYIKSQQLAPKQPQ